MNLSSLAVLEDTIHYTSAFKQQNKENIDQSQNFDGAVAELEKLRVQVSHYKKKTRKLEEKIEDHQLLE